MAITLNGKPIETSAANLTDLLTELRLPPETTLVEHNATATLRTDWPTTPLAEGDRIEVLHVAAGG